VTPLSPVDPMSPGLLTAGSVRELASGVDALYLSGQVDVPTEFLQRLDQYRAVAQAGGSPVPFSFGGIEFGLAPHGWGRYRFCLSHESGLIGITTSKLLPPVRIQPRAEYLHGLGAESTIDAFRTAIDRELGWPSLSVSRIDLFADFQGWDVGSDDPEEFVTRAKQLTVRSDRGKRTGLEFGRRSTGSITGRIYDKSTEILHSGKTWWYDVWGERHAEGQPVWRVEFEYGRGFLRELSLDPPEDVLEGAGDLWAYATEDWLSHRTPTADQTRSRRPVSDTWKAVQQASLRSDAIGLNRALERKKEATLEGLLPVLRGCFTSASAQWGADGMVEALDRFGSYLHSWETATGHTIEGEIATKRRNGRWGL